MSSTISTLLAIARGGNQPSTRTTVSALIAATLQSTTRDIPHIQIRGNDDVPEHARVNATIDAGVRALAPLVDNAYQHALSHIDFSVRESSRAIAIAITVSDDGPGLASADQAGAVRRGRPWTRELRRRPRSATRTSSRPHTRWRRQRHLSPRPHQLHSHPASAVSRPPRRRAGTAVEEGRRDRGSAPIPTRSGPGQVAVQLADQCGQMSGWARSDELFSQQSILTSGNTRRL
jgi:hypothetical protein